MIGAIEWKVTSKSMPTNFQHQCENPVSKEASCASLEASKDCGAKKQHRAVAKKQRFHFCCVSLYKRSLLILFYWNLNGIGLGM